MQGKSLMIDTSKMRVLGDAVVNFGEETVDMYLVPKSKSPQFVSLANRCSWLAGLKTLSRKFKTPISPVAPSDQV